MFLGCPSESACVRPSVLVRVCVKKSLLARYLTMQWTKFHQNLVEFRRQMNCLDFEGRGVKIQGRYEVRCEKLWDPYLLNGLKDHHQI